MTRNLAGRIVPWVGVGTTGEWTSPMDAIEASGLDYEVEQVSAYDSRGTTVPGIMVNRKNTGEIMGVTSNQYGVVQNTEAFSLLEPFCKANGVIEHAGMTSAGMCFMVMRMPGMAFGFKGDDFELYVCAMNSFNTKFPLALIITPVRVYCQNMFRKLMKRGDALLVIKHGRFATDRIVSASKASAMLIDYELEFQAHLAGSYNLEADTHQLQMFVEKLLPFTPVTPEHPRAKFTNERIELQRSEFIEDYYYAPDNLKYEGTKLGILNAYYDWITHHTPVRASENFDELRFGNLLMGSAVNRKLIESA